MDDTAQAIEALETHDVDRIKEALTWLIRHGEITALEHTLPLIQHPHVAIRWYAKKAVRALRERARCELKPEPVFRHGLSECTQALQGDEFIAAGAGSTGTAVETGVAVRHRNQPRRPAYFRVEIII